MGWKMNFDIRKDKEQRRHLPEIEEDGSFVPQQGNLEVLIFTGSYYIP